MQQEKPFIIILSGPTAVGKTEISIDIAKKFGMEIINADSMQVYKYMDIGTAKPSPEERKLVRHHLIDIVNPDEDFDAGKYRELATTCIWELWQKNIIPLVVGGTGLYIRVLTRGICGQIPKDETIRNKLRKDFEKHGPKELYFRLKKVDPQIALKVHPNDKQRILRALEVFESTGKPLSKWQEKHNFSDNPFRTLKIFIFREREEIYRRIDKRTEKMFANGLIEETEELLKKGFAPDAKPLQSIGYKQAVSCIMGLKSIDEAIEETKKETKHYAKRQFTWFRKEPDFKWIHANESKLIEKMILEGIKNAKGYR